MSNPLKKHLLCFGIADFALAVHADEVILSTLPMFNPSLLNTGTTTPPVFKPLAVTLSLAESFMFQSLDSLLVFVGKCNKAKVTFLTFLSDTIVPKMSEYSIITLCCILKAVQEKLSKPALWHKR